MNRPTSDSKALKNDGSDDTVPLLSSVPQQSSSQPTKDSDKAKSSQPAGGTSRQPGKKEKETIEALKQVRSHIYLARLPSFTL